MLMLFSGKLVQCTPLRYAEEALPPPPHHARKEQVRILQLSNPVVGADAGHRTEDAGPNNAADSERKDLREQCSTSVTNSVFSESAAMPLHSTAADCPAVKIDAHRKKRSRLKGGCACVEWSYSAATLLELKATYVCVFMRTRLSGSFDSFETMRNCLMACPCCVPRPAMHAQG